MARISSKALRDCRRHCPTAASSDRGSGGLPDSLSVLCSPVLFPSRLLGRRAVAKHSPALICFSLIISMPQSSCQSSARILRRQRLLECLPLPTLCRPLHSAPGPTEGKSYISWSSVLQAGLAQQDFPGGRVSRNCLRILRRLVPSPGVHAQSCKH